MTGVLFVVWQEGKSCGRAQRGSVSLPRARRALWPRLSPAGQGRGQAASAALGLRGAGGQRGSLRPVPARGASFGSGAVSGRKAEIVGGVPQSPRLWGSAGCGLCGALGARLARVVEGKESEGALWAVGSDGGSAGAGVFFSIELDKRTL